MNVYDKAEAILYAWGEERYDMIGLRGDGSVYPCREDDIPRGAVDAYLSIATEDAVILLATSIERGFKYGPDDPWAEEHPT